jgi:MFS family permease
VFASAAQAHLHNGKATDVTAESIIRRYSLLSFIRGLNFLSAVLTTFFSDWAGITDLELRVLQTWFLVCLILLDVPTGAFADRYGRKLSLTLGAFVMIIGFIQYGWVASYPLFFLGEFLVALGGSLLNGADNAWLVEQLKLVGYKADRRIFGKLRSISLAGLLAGGPIGGVIAYYFGTNAAMQFSAIPACVALLIILSLPEVKVRTQHRLTFWQKIKEGSQVFKMKPGIRRLTMATFFTYTGGYFIIWLYQPILRGFGFDENLFGWVHAVLVLAQVIVCYQFDLLHRLFRTSRNYVRFCTVMLAGSLLLAAYFPNYLTVGILILLGGGFGLTINDYVKASFQQQFEDEQRATLQSYVSAFQRTGPLVGNVVVGLISTHYSVRTAVLGLGIFSLFSLLVPLSKELLED